jgi:hypothetical protein
MHVYKMKIFFTLQGYPEKGEKEKTTVQRRFPERTDEKEAHKHLSSPKTQAGVQETPNGSQRWGNPRCAED